MPVRPRIGAPGEVEQPVSRLKDTVYTAADPVATAHDLLNRYLWPGAADSRPSLHWLQKELAALESA